MSSTGTESVKSANSTASSHEADGRQLWDQEILNQERAQLEQWANSGTAVTQNIFVPDDIHCGIWHQSPNKTRYASFGDHGTTASVSCYGDLIQMSQYLDVGHSGVFTIEQEGTPEPFQVADRAKHLDDLAKNMGSKFSFLLIIPDDCCPNEDDPPEVMWVNWRWPRYQYCPPCNNDVKCCYQFMAHEGVVLQQFTLENKRETPVEVGPFEILSKVLIRDLDFLDEQYPFNETPEHKQSEWSNGLGPDGYSHVYMHTLPGHDEDCDDRCLEHAVAAICTTFVNGSAVNFSQQDENTSVFFEKTELGGTKSSQNKVEIVLARKLIVLPNHPIDWRNFVVSATAGDINHWLRHEKDTLWDKEDDKGITRCLPRTCVDSQSAKKEEPLHDRSKSDCDSRVAVRVHEDRQCFQMPTSTPKSASNWNPNDHLEYLAWRHLEHILSNGEVEIPSRDTSPSVAFTCGDMSGHRINTSASFFAFKYLVDVGYRLRLLELKKRTRYIDQLETRIKTTLIGHIRWLQMIRTPRGGPFSKDAEQMPREDGSIPNAHIIHSGCFVANYWVTGEVMPENKDNSTWQPTWQPQNRMTDTALHILKLAEYNMLVPDSDDVGLRISQEVLYDIYVPWLTELNRLDIRETCSWSHSKIQRVTKFRLDDHFWIWRALKFLDTAVSKIRLTPIGRGGEVKEIPEMHKKWLRFLSRGNPAEQEPELNSPLPAENETLKTQDLKDTIGEFMQIAKRLNPDSVQRAMLQRFTTGNDKLKPSRRMLAVTRSAMETRFLLHARDTALFHDETMDFFMPGSSFMQLWANTIDVQLNCEENIAPEWDNPLRYALGILIGIQGGTVSRIHNAHNLIKNSLNVLIGASGSDAFFPGQLDEWTRAPAIFGHEQYRDYFFHTGFEINCILLSNSKKIENCLHERETRPAAQPKDQSPPYPKPGHSRIFEKSAEHGRVLTVRPNSANRVTEEQPNLILKKFVPFTNVIPTTKPGYIDDEWLYQYPDFLRGRGLSDNNCSSHDRSLSNSSSETEIDGDQPKLSIHVIDICKGKRQKGQNKGVRQGTKKAKHHQFASKKELSRLLSNPRTAWIAKKRLVWLPHADNGTAETFGAASTKREESQLQNFFARHSIYTKDMRDNVDLVTNEWQTELYLSFYVLVKNDGAAESSAKGLAGLPDRDNSSMSIPGRADHKIRRASMSFRFDGDFFDRFWTCYFIEYLPSGDFRGDWHHSFDVDSKSGDLAKQWAQRKVLELYFVQQILDKMNKETAEFLKEIGGVLGIEHGNLALVRDTPMKAHPNELRRLETIVQLVEEDLASNSDVMIKKWNRRATDRGDQNPRWTPNDENKYRADIIEFGVAVERETDKMKAHQDSLHKLREALAATRKDKKDEEERKQNELRAEQIENDRKREADEGKKERAQELHRREQKEELERKQQVEEAAIHAKEAKEERKERARDANIRNLTYVTVIFQPLGFAASFYSMGGPPEASLIALLVKFAISAFSVTLMLILGYRAIASASRRRKNAASEEPTQKIVQPVRDLARGPMQKAQEPEEPARDPAQNPMHEQPVQVPATGAKAPEAERKEIRLSAQRLTRFITSGSESIADFIIRCWEREIVLKVPARSRGNTAVPV